VRFGRGFGVAEYLLLIALSYAVPVILFLSGMCGRAVLLPLLSAPLALPLCRAIVVEHGAVLNRTLAGTARLLLVFGLLFALGIVL
jgi:1,4-dihydroxy-2-naphthoate octaprenyltransferase